MMELDGGTERTSAPPPPTQKADNAELMPPNMRQIWQPIRSAAHRVPVVTCADWAVTGIEAA
jgi:hypothetical protein